MIKKTKFILILLTGCWLLVTPVLGQGQAGQDIAVLKAGVGARPLGMGGAFTAIADNADSPFWNPAGLGFIEKNEITTMQTKLSTDADHYYVSYIRPAFGGTLGISWIQVGLGTITEVSSEVDVHNEVQNLSVFSYFSNAYMLSYGREVNDRLSVGLTAKYLTSDMFQITGGQASGYSVTPGILIKLGKAEEKVFTLGIKIDELLNQQIWGTALVEQVPAKLRLGLAYRSPNPGLFAIDISQTLKSNYAAEASAGYEWSKDGLAIRLGYSDGFTAGAGFSARGAAPAGGQGSASGGESVMVHVDYAFVTQKNLSRENVHRISLTGTW